jgi:hypothetical protein
LALKSDTVDDSLIHEKSRLPELPKEKPPEGGSSIQI